MPRRGSGSMGCTKQKGGTSRRTRSPKNGYDPVYRRADWRVQPVTSTPDVVLVLPELSRKNGSGQIPQAPKPQPKGGSKPAGTSRGK